jgi:archaellum component FlaG (FlaF/FlaG flagellin family)
MTFSKYKMATRTATFLIKNYGIAGNLHSDANSLGVLTKA